jgi:formylglycine-generating enzyme required for sulfatase activity
MQIRFASLILLLTAAATLLFWGGGCSEEEPTESDVTAPVVAFVNPVSYDQTTVAITDEIVFSLHADDPSGIDRVEIWITFHADTAATKIGEISAADSTGYFSMFWQTAGTANGAEGVLWALAFDAAGNRGRSALDVPIRVINSGEVGPPTPLFSITPPRGTVATEFKFDPTFTRDDIDPLEDIKVRWDFDGDGMWDKDTSECDAATAVYFSNYTVPREYVVRMQAFNTYYPAAAPPAEVRLVVTHEHGIPDPRNPDDFIRIEPGDYPIGVVRAGAGAGLSYDDREMVEDTLFVRISSPYLIEKYEVTNELYVAFLNDARADGLIEYDPYAGEREIRWLETGEVLISLTQTQTRVKFIDAQTGFGVDAEFLQHPVTGVSWFGAEYYAQYSGLRLPTEMEWEAAARGQMIDTNETGTYLYPWEPGDVITGAHANFDGSGDPYDSQVIPTTPAGGYNGSDIGGFATENAISTMGTYDQAGNVAEWVNDWYSNTIYAELLEAYLSGTPPLNPQGPSNETGAYPHRVYRGGSFTDEPAELRVTGRRATFPETMSRRIGFRTAYSEFQ